MEFLFQGTWGRTKKISGLLSLDMTPFTYNTLLMTAMTPCPYNTLLIFTLAQNIGLFNHKLKCALKCMITMHARLRRTDRQTYRQTDGQTDERHDNSATIRSNERIAR